MTLNGESQDQKPLNLCIAYVAFSTLPWQWVGCVCQRLS